MKGKMENLLITGAIAGAVTPFILKYAVSPILNMIGQYTPTVTAKLANPALEINVGQSITGFTTGLGNKVVTWLTNSLGVTIPTNIIMDVAIAAIGGALLFVLGGYLAEYVKYLGAKSAVAKTAVVILGGNLIAGLILGIVATPIVLGVTFVNVLIAMSINAGLLALIVMLAEPYVRKVLPF